VSFIPSLAQQAAAPQRDPFYLRHDRHLRPTFKLTEINPSVPSLLERLGQATGLRFTLADNLKHHQPEYGDLQLGDAPAFMVMEMMALRDIDDAYWEKTKDGYRLTGTSRALKPPAGAGRGRWLVLGGAAVGLASIGVCALLYWRRRKRSARRGQSGARAAAGENITSPDTRRLSSKGKAE
jgi:hypothetical protein